MRPFPEVSGLPSGLLPNTHHIKDTGSKETRAAKTPQGGMQQEEAEGARTTRPVLKSLQLLERNLPPFSLDSGFSHLNGGDNSPSW